MNYVFNKIIYTFLISLIMFSKCINNKNIVLQGNRIVFNQCNRFVSIQFHLLHNIYTMYVYHALNTMHVLSV